MKSKWLILLVIALIFVLVISIDVGCKTATTTETAAAKITEAITAAANTAAETTILETTATVTTASETAIPETTAAETTVPETTAEAAIETTAEATTESAAEKGKYSVGDTGPAGGLIFYVNPDYKTAGWRYLEAAPASTEWKDMNWSNIKDALAGAAGTAVGTGKANAAAIIGQLGHTASPAKLCDDLITGEYSDWFFPSKDELNLIYLNLVVAGLGGFTSDYYWSSSEIDAKYAWLQSFFYKSNNANEGSQNSSLKGSYGRVRAVRAF